MSFRGAVKLGLFASPLHDRRGNKCRRRAICSGVCPGQKLLTIFRQLANKFLDETIRELLSVLVCMSTTRSWKQSCFFKAGTRGRLSASGVKGASV